jgi:hypothetical protein
MSKIIMFILLELVTATIYHADPRQTDDSPFVTASMAKINPSNPLGHRWIAVSRDLEDLGFVFDTKVCVTGAEDLSGEWCVQDRMNSRWIMRIDFLVNKTRKGGKWEDVKIELITE